MLYYQSEKYLSAWPELEPLVKMHHQEVNLFGDKLDVDTDGYAYMCENDILKLFTIRKNDDELVGYAAYYVYPHNHHRTSLHAKLDVLFILKEYRGGRGKSFLKFCEEELKAMNVEVVHIGVPAINDWSKMLTDYEKLETVYMRRLT